MSDTHATPTQSPNPESRTPNPGFSRPSPAPPRPYHFPHFERSRLPNGIRLLVAPVTKLPLVTVSVITEAGAVCDPPEREGIARLTAQLLLEGTTTSDGAALTDRFERLGASVESSADWDSAELSMTVLVEQLEPGFELLGEVLRTPAFSEREVERLEAERVAELLQLRAEPRGLADEMLGRFVYDSSSRYARPDGGDERSVAAIGRDDVARFHRARYAPGATTIIVAGDVRPEAIEALASRVLGDWSGETPAVVEAADRPRRASRATHLVVKPDAAQSELRMGHVGAPRGTPDYFPTVVMNAVLGGLFSSRINLNLREQHGYTYGAFSGFDWRRQAGPFYVSTAVGSEVTEAAAREILVEIDRMRTEEIREDELTLATSYLDGVFPIRYETTDAIAGALTALVVYGLPDDYFDRYRERVRAVTTADVLTAAQRHLHPDALQLVVVGSEAIRESLESLGFGPLGVYDTEGRERREE